MESWSPESVIQPRNTPKNAEIRSSYSSPGFSGRMERNPFEPPAKRKRADPVVKSRNARGAARTGSGTRRTGLKPSMSSSPPEQIGRDPGRELEMARARPEPQADSTTAA